MYFRTLCECVTSYANVITLQILNYLCVTYRSIKPSDIVKNDEKMKRSYDPFQPFKVIINQIEDEVDFAIMWNTSYSLEQVVIITYNLIFQTGLFSEACREWNKKYSKQVIFQKIPL